MSSTEKRNVAVVGSSPALQGERISYGANFEIWAASGLKMSLSRCDRWFEVEDRLEHPTWKDSQRLKWLKEQNTVIYVLNPTPDMPRSVYYPKDKVANACHAYFTDPLSYMIALAIYEHFDRISIHAVQHSASRDYEVKANIEYLLGIASGRGIKIDLPDDSTLLRSPRLYGYDQVSLYDHLWARLWRMNDEVYRLTKELDGLRERVEPEKDLHNETKINTLRRRQRELISQRAKVEGSMEECRFWMSWTSDTGFDET